MLKNLENFPNQPDVEAKFEGYPDKATQLRDQQSKRQLSSIESEAEMNRQHQNLIDQRRLDQQFSLQDQMFSQGTQTSRFEHQQAKDLETHKSKLKIKEAKAAPKTKPVTKPAAKKPVK